MHVQWMPQELHFQAIAGHHEQRILFIHEPVSGQQRRVTGAGPVEVLIGHHDDIGNIDPILKVTSSTFPGPHRWLAAAHAANGCKRPASTINGPLLNRTARNLVTQAVTTRDFHAWAAYRGVVAGDKPSVPCSPQNLL